MRFNRVVLFFAFLAGSVESIFTMDGLEEKQEYSSPGKIKVDYDRDGPFYKDLYQIGRDKCPVEFGCSGHLFHISFLEKINSERRVPTILSFNGFNLELKKVTLEGEVNFWERRTPCSQGIILPSKDEGFKLVILDGTETQVQTILPQIKKENVRNFQSHNSKVILQYKFSDQPGWLEPEEKAALSIHDMDDKISQGRDVYMPFCKLLTNCGEKFLAYSDIYNRIFLMNPQGELLIENAFDLPNNLVLRHFTGDDNAIVFSAIEAKSSLDTLPLSYWMIHSFTNDTTLTQLNLLPKDYRPIGFHLKKQILFIVGELIGGKSNHEIFVNGEFREDKILHEKDGIFKIFDLKEERILLEEFLPIRPIQSHFSGHHFFMPGIDLSTGNCHLTSFNVRRWLS